jgi:hypothetical protein
MYELKVTAKLGIYSVVHENKILGTIRSAEFNGFEGISEMIDKANQFDVLSKNFKNHITDMERSIETLIVESETAIKESTMEKLRKQILLINSKP